MLYNNSEWKIKDVISELEKYLEILSYSRFDKIKK